MADKKGQGKKGKVKLNLDEAALIPGRHFCQCHAQLHGLVNNCLICGRIVCEQEGPGACFFCGNDVLMKGQRADFDQDEQAFPEFQDPNSDINKAIQHKNKMIEFDKSNFIQKNVFDEQTDWYSIADDVWQDKKARKQATAQIAARQDEIEENDKYIHVQFDTQQMKWVENKPIFDEEKFKRRAQEFLGDVEQKDREGRRNESSNSNSDDDDDDGFRKAVKASANTSLKSEQQNLYNEIFQELTLVKQASEAKEKSLQQQSKQAAQSKKAPEKRLASVVQSDEFVEFQKEIQNIMLKEIEANDKQIVEGVSPYDSPIYNMQFDDEGKCLSLLQPWASLVVEGFMRFEGRFWTTDYKGPLYIHAGATPPTQQQIDEIETQFKEHYKGVANLPPFPRRYPTGSLIGCVDLQGVLTRDEYIANVPEKYREDSKCDYVFVVRNPRKLFYPVKMKGSKNIFDIPDDIRINSRSQLIQVPSTWFEWAAKDLDFKAIQGGSEEEGGDEEEGQVELTEEQKLEANYPTLSSNASKGSTAQPQQLAPTTLSKKRSNQKKDFMQSAEIHQKLNKLASEIKVKMEGFGFMLAPFLSVPEQKDISDYFFLKGGSAYKIGSANLGSLVCDPTFPHLEKIVEITTKTYCYFTEGKKSDCLNQLKTVDWFYLNPKQKRFGFQQDYFLILILGADYEIVVQNNKTYKTKQVPVQNATALMQLYDEHTSIIFETHDSNSKGRVRELGIKDTLTNLVICFKNK